MYKLNPEHFIREQGSYQRLPGHAKRTQISSCRFPTGPKWDNLSIHEDVNCIRLKQPPDNSKHTHTLIHMHSHILIHTPHNLHTPLILTHICSCTLTHTYTQTPHTPMHTHHLHILSETHLHTYTPTPTHTPTHTLTHTLTYTCVWPP